MPDPTCIFCKIVAGAIPCHKIHEDPDVLTFLDVGPLSRGHCLVIPKQHYVTLDQVPDDTAAAIGRLLPRLARAVVKATGIPDWNVLQNNGRPAHQVVPHVHFHLIPKSADAGLGITWPAGKLDPAQAPKLLADIRAAM